MFTETLRIDKRKLFLDVLENYQIQGFYPVSDVWEDFGNVSIFYYADNEFYDDNLIVKNLDSFDVKDWKKFFERFL